MKKAFIPFITLSFLFSFSFIGISQNIAHACSPVAGETYPTPESVLESSDGAAIIIRTIGSGYGILGEVVGVMQGEKKMMNHVPMLADGTSCSSLFSFKSNQFALVITPQEKDFFINHVDLDDQFSYFFGTQIEAENKYKELTGQTISKLPAPEPTDPSITPEPTPGENVPAVCGDNYYEGPGFTLRPGLKGDQNVMDMQRALKVLGLYDMNIDGSYGPGTKAAVTAFQKSKGLTADGLAGKKTQQALSEMPELGC